MKDKNLNMGNAALRQDITRRFMWTLARMLKTGSVTKQGWGADARLGDADNSYHCVAHIPDLSTLCGAKCPDPTTI